MKTNHALILAVSIFFTGLIASTAQQTSPNSLPGCIYVAAGITLSNLQTTLLRCDINGHLKVNTSTTP